MIRRFALLTLLTTGLIGLGACTDGDDAGTVDEATAVLTAGANATGTATAPGAEPQSPAEVVETFIDEVTRSAPPTADAAALQRAHDRLTERARDRVTDGAGLGPFMGLQDLPDMGVEVETTEETADTATVRTRLRYSGGDVERVFHLHREQDRWRIDWVDAFPVSAESEPETVTEAFLAHVFAAAPPTSNERAAQAAAALLSAEAADALGEPLSGALAGFLGVQDVPDEGYEVGEASVEGDTARVPVTLRYSGGPAERVVTLEQTDAGWRISEVSEP